MQMKLPLLLLPERKKRSKLSWNADSNLQDVIYYGFFKFIFLMWDTTFGCLAIG